MAKSRRTVKVPASAWAILKDHLAQQEENQQYVFVTRVGTPIAPRDLVKVFLRLIEKAGAPDTRFHDLRHLCATLHLQAGTNSAVVASILDHSTLNLTLNTYSHVLPHFHDEAAERLDKLISGPYLDLTCWDYCERKAD